MPIRTTDNWPEVRKYFVESEERPTYAELAAKYSIPEPRIVRIASQEGWPLMRAKHIEEALQKCGAGEVILESIGIHRDVTKSMASLGLAVLQKLAETVGKMKADAAASSDASTLNNITFAAANMAKAMKDAGIVGLPKELADNAKFGNGKWSPQLLGAINLTIQNLVGRNGAEEKPAASPVESAPAVALPAPALALPEPVTSPFPDLHTSARETVPESSDVRK